MSGPATVAPRITGTAWLDTLLPVQIDPSLRLPDPTRIEYLCLRWTSCEEATVTLRGSRVARPEPGDTLVVGEALAADGAVVARLELAAGRGAETHRHPDDVVPPLPAPRFGSVARRRIIRAEQVEAYRTDVVGTDPAIPERATREGALPLPVVPGTLLVEFALSAALRRSSGQVEAWFGDPVPVGALIEVHELRGEPVEIHVAGRDRPAVVFGPTTS